MTNVRTVSVLFTDLVDSTELRVRIGDAVADDVLRRHFSMLAELVSRHGGEQVKTQGDGLMAVFDSATEAISCAARMQQEVARSNRRQSVHLGLRVGISIGEATIEGRDFFGTPVIEAARLCAAANGGQILANDVLRVLIGSRAEHALTPSGHRSLKGLPEPVSVCEVEWHPPVPDVEYAGTYSDVDRAAQPEALIGMLDDQRQRPFFAGLRQQSYDLLEIQPGDRILDLGCGPGDDTQEIARMVGADGVAVGVDSSATMIAEAKSRADPSLARNLEFRVDDALHLEFDDGSFDGTRAERLFQHLADPIRALHEMKRVTKPGRRVVVCDSDWGTFTVAHPDRDLTRRIFDHWCDARPHGWIGRQLTGLFAQCELDDLVVRANVSANVEWDDFWSARFEPMVANAVDAEVVGPDEGARWIARLHDTVASGGFVASLVLYTVAGRVAND